MIPSADRSLAPVVEVVPIRIREGKSLRGSVTVHGDIVGPILDQVQGARRLA